MYTALYRTYRPEVFDEILGQDHIVKILKNQINTDSASHAYLFCGTRGTGKTTTARILAKGLNCTSEGQKPCGVCSACQAIKAGSFIDVVEIDAASNNGVDNIRELRETVKYPPVLGRKKVYIIDEVHMLSSGASNALLKTLEEPPEYVVFILATTEPQSLPATILSRCMRLDFRRVPEGVLIGGMADICRKKGIDVSEDALRIIAANADGSVRDGLSILEQCTAGGDRKIEPKDVLEFLGASGEETFVELTDFVRRGKTADALVLLDRILSDGKDVRQFMRDWVNHYRNLLMTKFMKNPQEVVNMSVENIDRIRKQGESIALYDINRGILEISETMREAKWSTQPRILLELVIVKLSSGLSAVAAGNAQAARMAANNAQAAMVAGNPSVRVQMRQGGKVSAGQEQKGTISSDQGAAATVQMPDGSGIPGALGLTGLSSASNAPGAPNLTNPNHMSDAPSAPDAQNAPGTPGSPGIVDALDTSGASDMAVQAYDLDEIWNAVFEDGEAAKGSFYMIGSSGRLVEIGDDSFTIEMTSASMKELAELNRKLLETLMEKHTGKQRTMKLVSAGGKKSMQGEQSIEEITRSAEELLGINIEIQ